MSEQLITILVTAFTTGIVPSIIAYLSYKQASEANKNAMKLEERKVDIEAYNTAQRILRETITDLELQLQNARTRITALEQSYYKN